MFDFFKKKEKQNIAKLEITTEQSAAFFKADRKARKAAGLENLPGEYTFICPNCGSECKGSWHAMYGMDNLHGRTDCFICNIHLMV